MGQFMKEECPAEIVRMIETSPVAVGPASQADPSLLVKASCARCRAEVEGQDQRGREGDLPIM